MSITASCGHLLTEKEGMGKDVHVKGEYFGEPKATYFLTLCNMCLERYKKEDIILKTKKARDEYLDIKPINDKIRLKQIDKLITRLQKERLNITRKMK